MCTECKSSIPPKQRRIHGLQWPLQVQQIIGWVILILTAVVFFTFISELMTPTYKFYFMILGTIFFTVHVIFHIITIVLDPAEKELRKLSLSTIPEFDRNKHRHVIENGRCHLCNIQTTSSKTKHCSICNKCVYIFDHHCKWLNHCIGKRNYIPFLFSVITALILSIILSSSSLTELVWLLTDPSKLNFELYVYNTNNSNFNLGNSNSFARSNYIIVIATLTLTSVINVILSGFLVHLCLFHIFITCRGVTTYEYIRNHEIDSTGFSISLQKYHKMFCCLFTSTQTLYSKSISRCKVVPYRDKLRKNNMEGHHDECGSDIKSGTSVKADDLEYVSTNDIKSYSKIFIIMNMTKRIFEKKNRVNPYTKTIP